MEFALMCDDDIIPKIKESCEKYAPIILQVGEHDDPIVSELTEEASYKAIVTIDKQLRSVGAASKAAAAYTLYPVSNMYVLYAHAGIQLMTYIAS